MDDDSSTKTTGLESRDTGRSTYVRVRTLVDHLKEQHRRLRETAEQAKKEREQADDSTESQRVALLYGWVASLEDGVATYLERFSDEERDRILETWLQYGDTTGYDRLVDRWVEDPPTESRELRGRLAALDQELADLYERLAGQANTGSLSELFGHLCETTLHRAKRRAEHLPQVEEL